MAEREQLVFEAVTRQASQEIRELSRDYRGAVGGMSDDALKLAAAQQRLDQALSRHGAGSNAARNAEIAFRKALQDTSIAAQREAGVLDQATAAKSRFGNAGLYASRGAQQLKTGVVGTTAGFLGSAGLVFALQSGVREAVEFDRSMRNVNSIAKLSEGGLKALSAEVLRLSSETGKGPKNLADGLYDIVSSGFSASDAVKILASSAKAATAGLTDTAVSSKAVVAILNAYHLSADQARRTSDLLFQEVNLGVNTFEELGQNIGDVVPQAAALKIPLEEVLAAIATITRGGTTAPEAFTQLSRVLTSIVKPSKELQAEFKRMGFSSGQAAVDALGFAGVLERLSKDAGGNQQVLAKWLGEVRGIRGIINLTGENLATYTSLVNGMGAATEGNGATQAAFAEQQKSVAFTLERSTANLKASAAAFVGSFNPSIVTATDLVGDLAAGLVELQSIDIKGKGQETKTLGDAFQDVLKWTNPVNAQLKYTNWVIGQIAGSARDAAAAFEEWQAASDVYYQPGAGPQPRGPETPDTTRPGAGTPPRTQQDYQVDLARARVSPGTADEVALLTKHRSYIDSAIDRLEADKSLTKKQKDRLLDLYQERDKTQSELDQIQDDAEREQDRRDSERERKRAERERKAATARREAQRAAELIRTGIEAGLKTGGRQRASDLDKDTSTSVTLEAPRNLRIQQLHAQLTEGTDDDLRVARAIESYWQRRLDATKKTAKVYEDILAALVAAHDGVKALEQQLSGSGPGSAQAAASQFQAELLRIVSSYAPNFGQYGGGAWASTDVYSHGENMRQQTDLLKKIAGAGSVVDPGYDRDVAAF